MYFNFALNLYMTLSSADNLYMTLSSADNLVSCILPMMYVCQFGVNDHWSRIHTLSGLLIHLSKFVSYNNSYLLEHVKHYQSPLYILKTTGVQPWLVSTGKLNSYLYLSLSASVSPRIRSLSLNLGGSGGT